PADLLKELSINRGTDGQKKKRRIWPIVLGILALIIAGLFVLKAMKPTEVETAKARSAADSGPASVLDASGYVTARRVATVSSKITGKVKEVLIEEGQRVKEGEILATLEATDASAQQSLSTSQLASAKSQLAEAQAQLKLAERNLARQRELAAKKLVAASSLDAAIAERDSRAARLVSLQRSVTVSQDQLSISNNGVDNTVIRAPFDGVIVTKAAQPGEMISPISGGGGSIRTGIGTLVDMDSLEIQVDVNEAYIGRVQPKMPVDAVLNAYPDWKIPAEVIAIIPTADRSKATVKVRIAMNSKDPRIVPDMGVRVSFLESRSADAPKPTGVWAPERAVIQKEGKSYVFVINDGVAKQTEVSVGDKRDADIMISKGLLGGETLVLSPSEKLSDGSKVLEKAAAAK
ncbi:MAG: efflux RND transporter periplasmic adaptor subunit, partial [Arenimonas sp.]